MYFKVEKGSPLYDNLIDLMKKAKYVQEEARKLVFELGYLQYRQRSWVLWGGISSILIPKDKPVPKDWSKADDGYMPRKYRKSTRDLAEKIKQLPVVEHDELNDLLGYDSNSSKTPYRTSFHPAFKYIKDKELFLISVADYMIYTPVDGMTEILSSEYNALSGKEEEEK